MNLFQLQERLKDFSKDQLVNEMKSPSGTAPPYLVLSELQRRTRMEQAMMADGQQAPQSTVADDTVAAAGVPQGGLGDMARALAPQTDMTQNDAAAPVQQMAEGGSLSDDAKARRGFGRTSYLSGLDDPGGSGASGDGRLSRMRAALESSNRDRLQEYEDYFNTRSRETGYIVPIPEAINPVDAAIDAIERYRGGDQAGAALEAASIHPGGRLSSAAIRAIAPEIYELFVPVPEDDEPVDEMAEGGQVENQSNADTVQSAISNIMGGDQAMSALQQQFAPMAQQVAPMAQQLTPAAQQLGLTAQGLSQAAKEFYAAPPPVVQQAAPELDTSRIDDILGRLSQPAQQQNPLTRGRLQYEMAMYQNSKMAPGDRSPINPRQFGLEPSSFSNRFGFGRNALLEPIGGPATPQVSEADLAYVMNNAPTQAQRQQALDAMIRQQSPQPQSTGLFGRGLGGNDYQFAGGAAEGGLVRMAEGGVVRMQEGGIADLYDMAQNTPWELGDDEWQELYGSAWSFMKRRALERASGEQPEAPYSSALSGTEMELRNQTREGQAPSLSDNVDMDLGGRSWSAQYPSQPSLLPGMPNVQRAEPVPEGLGIEGVINPEAVVLGSGEMAAGHSLPDRLLNIPGINESMDRGPQYVGAMQNLIGLSDEGMPAQLAAEDAVMGMPVPAAPVSTYRDPNIDTTDDARAARGFGRSAYLDGLVSPADSPSLLDMIPAPSQGEPRTAMSAGEVGAPRPSLVPDFVTDPETEMDRLTRQSAEDVAKLRDEAGIEESLRTDEDKAAAAAAARKSLVPALTPSGGGTGGTGGTGSGSASSSISASETTSGGEGGDNSNKWLALARFGLGLMQSQQPTFGGAIGEAGMGALDELRALEDRDYERSMAERDFALKQAIAAARSSGRGGGGGGGGGAGAGGYELGLSTDAARLLDSLEDDLNRVDAMLMASGYVEGEDAPRGAAMLLNQRRGILDDMRRIRDINTGGAMTALSQSRNLGGVSPDVSNYDLTQ